MDPATVGVALKTASMVSGMLTDGQIRPKFGLGKPATESNCSSLAVFMTCVGRTSTDRIRMQLPPSTTPIQARDAFAVERARGAVEQEHIEDEFGFRLGSGMRKRPMTSISNGCSLALNFVYAASAVEHGASAVEKEIGRITLPKWPWGGGAAASRDAGQPPAEG